MRDRQPTKVLENGAVRYAVYDEAGAFLRYDYLLPADEPLDEGTALEKSTLLTDETETALFGSATDRTVNQAFAGIANKISLIMSDMATMKLTVKSAAGNPVPGVLVSGVFDESGNTMTTDDSGVISGYVTEGSATISISGYADIADYSETIEVTKGASYTKEISVTVRNFLKLTSSKSVKFSGNVNRVDHTVVGAGGGGSRGWNSYSGAGGGGGYCVVSENVEFEPQKSYAASIGSGGAGSTSISTAGGTGGTTSFMGVSATGGNGGSAGKGSGGTGNGSGGASADEGKIGNNGGAGTVLGFASFTTTARYGGGGGSGTAKDGLSAGTGGADFGAAGGTTNALSGAGYPGASGTGGGGGGGCGVNYGDGEGSTEGSGGKGGSGCVAIRMHLTAA